jgi:acyl carrier protein
MSEDDLRAAVLSALGEVAPEADLAHLDPAADLREALEIDSMDFLNLAIAVAKATGVEVPEVDYPKLASIDAWTGYLAARVGEKHPGWPQAPRSGARSEPEPSEDPSS